MRTIFPSIFLIFNVYPLSIGDKAEFSWIKGARQVHNVNYLNELQLGGSSPKTVYDTCDFAGTDVDLKKEDPNVVKTVTKSDGDKFQYFVCGFGDGFHCEHGVKARFHVVNDTKYCHIHPYTYNC